MTTKGFGVEQCAELVAKDMLHNRGATACFTGNYRETSTHQRSMQQATCACGKDRRPNGYNCRDCARIAMQVSRARHRYKAELALLAKRHAKFEQLTAAIAPESGDAS